MAGPSFRIIWPAIHVFAAKPKVKDVDGPIKSGHDDVGGEAFQTVSKCPHFLADAGVIGRAANLSYLLEARDEIPPHLLAGRFDKAVQDRGSNDGGR
jgi:hypothetical protein